MYQCNQLMDKLLIGPIPHGGTMLADNGINTVVLCAHEHQDDTIYPGVEVIKAGGSDAVPMRSGDDKVWMDTAQMVAQRVKEGKTVLVTCMAGQNRSGFVSVVALHLLTGASGEECIKHVKKFRPGSLWNTAFCEWLTANLKPSVVDGG